MNIVKYKNIMGKRLFEGLIQIQEESENSIIFVNYLLEHGAYVDYQEPETGYTSLMLAIEHDLEDTFDILLSYSPDLEISNKIGATSLHIAAASKNPHYLEKLCKKRVFIDAADRQGNTAINYAIKAEVVPNIRILRKYGCTLNYLNYFGKSIYDEALETENEKVIACVYNAEKKSNNLQRKLTGSLVQKARNLLNKDQI